MAEFHEYPKWVSFPGHDPILCEDADEESALRAAHEAKASAPAVATSTNALVGGFHAGNARTVPDGDRVVAAVLPKKSGWPKGKRRGARNAVVN